MIWGSVTITKMDNGYVVVTQKRPNPVLQQAPEVANLVFPTYDEVLIQLGSKIPSKVEAAGYKVVNINGSKFTTK